VGGFIHTQINKNRPRVKKDVVLLFKLKLIRHKAVYVQSLFNTDVYVIIAPCGFRPHRNAHPVKTE
jgi:hypothetical protein